MLVSFPDGYEWGEVYDSLLKPAMCKQMSFFSEHNILQISFFFLNQILKKKDNVYS